MEDPRDVEKEIDEKIVNSIMQECDRRGITFCHGDTFLTVASRLEESQFQEFLVMAHNQGLKPPTVH